LEASAYQSPTTPPTALQIADAVLDEALSEHVAAGSFGEAAGRLDAAVSSRLASNDPAVSNLDAAVSSRLASNDPAVSNLDAAVSSRLAAADYQATSAPSALEIADAVLDEALSEHTIAGSFGEAAGRLDANVSSITVGEVSVSVDESTIHAALDTWNPDYSTNPPPVILPPNDAQDCRVGMALGKQAGVQGPPATVTAWLRIIQLPYFAWGRYWTGAEFEGDYDPATGLLTWEVARGANCSVRVEGYGIRKDFTVPDEPTFLI
jgi:hypothetical protein